MKKMIKGLNLLWKSGIRTVAACLVIVAMFSSSIVSAVSYSRVHVSDTIAGLGTQLEVSQLNAGANVIFNVTAPDGREGQISAYADDNGVAMVKLSKADTHLAGKYNVAVQSSRTTMPGPSSVFSVYPGSLSLDQSEVVIDKVTVRPDKKDEATIDIYLRDEYKNPIAYHQVQPISGRDSDEFILYSGSSFSDSAGHVQFGLRSEKAGVSQVAMYDMTAQKFLSDATKINFTNSRIDGKFGSAIGGHYGKSIFQDKGTFTILSEDISLVFPNFPETVQVGEPFSFTLEIEDVDGYLLGDFEGFVGFTIPGVEIGDVVIPEDYEFTFEDQGAHTFPLSLQFQREGTYTLIAESLDDPNVFAEQTVVVGSGVSSSLFDGSDFSDITITQPGAGVYNNSSQVIEGKASPGLTIKIYDNDREIASVNTDIQGAFKYTTAPLADGEHTIYAVSISNEGQIVGVSEDVLMTIDTSAPVVTAVVLDPPNGANPNQFVKISARVDEDLTQLIAEFEGSSIELKQSSVQDSLYEGVLQAPTQFGTYPIDLILVDALGNQSVSEQVAFVVVGSGSVEEAFVAKVERLEAHPSDSKVTLLWSEVQSVQPIRHYRIYYGLNPEVLNHIVDTHGTDTNWYIPNLANGTTYYFALTAVDTQGNESVDWSRVVSAVPFVTEISEPVPEIVVPEEPVAPEVVTESPKVQGDTGPEMLGLLLFSALGGNFIIARRRK